jgi:hypothetical protein
MRRFLLDTGIMSDLINRRLGVAKRVGGKEKGTQIVFQLETSCVPFSSPVTIGGDWVGSSIAAGVDIGADNQWGTADDARISGASTTDNPNIVSKITSVTIKGLVYGTPTASGADHFGFVAQQIGSFKALGFMAALTAGTDAAIELAPTTGDVTLREVV